MEELAGISAEWDLLARQIRAAHAVHLAGLVHPVVDTFPAPADAMPRRVLLPCHHGGRLVAVAPLMHTSRPGIGPPVLRIVPFFGVDAALTEIRGLICRTEDQAPVVEALVKYFLACCGKWDVFRWAGLHHPAGTYGTPRLPCAFVARGGFRREVATPSTALVPERKVGFPHSEPPPSARFPGNKVGSARRNIEPLQ